MIISSSSIQGKVFGFYSLKAFWVFVIFFLITGNLAFGQEKGTFKGQVVADDTGEPLIGAHIKLKNDISIGAISDIDGNFAISVNPGTQLFLVSFTGMQIDSLSVNIVAGQVTEKVIRMKPYVNILEGVEIKVGKFDRPYEEITVSMEVLKPGLIENKNTTNIKTILDYTPGLNILDGEPQIRGGSGFTFGVGSKVGIIVDDMPLLSPDATRPYWELISVENIEQIEVIKGCASVLAGANAISGSINIRSASPGLEPLTKIKAYVGGYTPPKTKYMKWWDNFPYLSGADFLHSRKIGNTDLVLAGSLNLDHGYQGAPQPAPYVIDTITDFTDAQMATQRGRLNFNLKHFSKKIEGLNYGLNGNFLLQHTNQTLAWLDDSAGFYRGYPGAVILQDQFMFYLDPFINFYSRIGIKHSFKSRILMNDNNASNDQENHSSLYFFDYNFKREYDFLKGFAFIGGLSTQYNKVHSNMYIAGGSPDNHLFNLSGYAEVENNIFKIINFSLGARIEYFVLNDSVKDFKPLFRAGASMKMMQETYVRMSFGQGYRYPTIAERFIRTDLGSIKVYENPELKPETGWNTEVGVKQGFKLAKFYGYLDIAGFLQEYNNTVEYLFGWWKPGSFPGFKFLNTGRSRVTGIDISLTGVGKIGKDGNLKVMFGYNYIMPKTLEPDYVYATVYQPDTIDYSFESTSVDPSNNILKYRFIHTIKGDVEYNYKAFSTGVSWRFFSRIENLDKAIEEFEFATKASGEMQPIEYMDYFNNHNSGNVILDFRVSYTFKAIHKISLISDNILNHWYSLRPLKAEPMRTITIQYAVQF